MLFVSHSSNGYTFLITVYSKTITHLWEESEKVQIKKNWIKKRDLFLGLDDSNESPRQTFNLDFKISEEKI